MKKKKGGEASSHQMHSLERSELSRVRPKRGRAGRGKLAWERRCGEWSTRADKKTQRQNKAQKTKKKKKEVKQVLTRCKTEPKNPKTKGGDASSHQMQNRAQKSKKKGGEATSHQMRSLERSEFSGVRPKRGGAGRGGLAWECHCGEWSTRAEGSRNLHVNLTTRRSRPRTNPGMYCKTERLNRTPTAQLQSNPANMQTRIHAKP